MLIVKLKRVEWALAWNSQHHTCNLLQTMQTLPVHKNYFPNLVIMLTFMSVLKCKEKLHLLMVIL